MKLVQQFMFLVALCVLSMGAAFCPSTTSGRLLTTVAHMGLFDGITDFFSEEARAKREAEKQKMIEEQEEAYREVLERRRNPDKMDEYMKDRKERLNKYMGGDDKKKEG